MDFSVFPWEDVSVRFSISDIPKKYRQSNRLRLKFRTDYEELRDHLDRAFLILLGWAMILNYFRTVATRNFIVSIVRGVAASPTRS